MSFAAALFMSLSLEKGEVAESKIKDTLIELRQLFQPMFICPEKTVDGMPYDDYWNGEGQISL